MSYQTQIPDKCIKIKINAHLIFYVSYQRPNTAPPAALTKARCVLGAQERLFYLGPAHPSGFYSNLYQPTCLGARYLYRSTAYWLGSPGSRARIRERGNRKAGSLSLKKGAKEASAREKHTTSACAWQSAEKRHGSACSVICGALACTLVPAADTVPWRSSPGCCL